MSLSDGGWVLLALSLGACADDHYEGGGRRRELPVADQTAPPNIGPGDGSSEASGGAGTGEMVGQAGSE